MKGKKEDLLHVKVWLGSSQRICFEAKKKKKIPHNGALELDIRRTESNTPRRACVCARGVSFYLLVFVISFEILSGLHNRFNYSAHEFELSKWKLGRVCQKCLF